MRLAPPPLPGPGSRRPLVAVVSASAPAASSTATIRLRQVRARPIWPLLPLAPLVVLVVGTAVAVAIGIAGVDHLARASNDHVGQRAELLADVVGARLVALPIADQANAVQL